MEANNMQMYDDMEIPELTVEDFKKMKPNPYASKFSIEDKIVMGIEAYISHGNVNKKKLKERLDVVLA